MPDDNTSITVFLSCARRDKGTEISGQLCGSRLPLGLRIELMRISPAFFGLIILESSWNPRLTASSKRPVKFTQKISLLAINIDGDAGFFYYPPRAAAIILTLKSDLIYLFLSDGVHLTPDH